jgi:hypothetical protein
MGVRRREFIAGLGGAAAWAVAARAQQPAQIQRVGVLMPGKNIPDVQDWVLTFEQQLNTLGWSNGRNLRVNDLWGENDPARLSQLAIELISRFSTWATHSPGIGFRLRCGYDRRALGSSQSSAPLWPHHFDAGMRMRLNGKAMLSSGRSPPCRLFDATKWLAERLRLKTGVRS